VRERNMGRTCLWNFLPTMFLLFKSLCLVFSKSLR
jgi:hypothetical protein